MSSHFPGKNVRQLFFWETPDAASCASALSAASLPGHSSSGKFENLHFDKVHGQVAAPQSWTSAAAASSGTSRASSPKASSKAFWRGPLKSSYHWGMVPALMS